MQLFVLLPYHTTIKTFNLEKELLPNLKTCIILDAIGCLSYVFPILGEVGDIVWAPVSAIIFFFLFGRRMGVFGGMFSFLEEITPGLDFIPTFTIAWFIRRSELENEQKPVRIPKEIERKALFR